MMHGQKNIKLGFCLLCMLVFNEKSEDLFRIMQF